MLFFAAAAYECSRRKSSSACLPVNVDIHYFPCQTRKVQLYCGVDGRGGGPRVLRIRLPDLVEHLGGGFEEDDAAAWLDDAQSLLSAIRLEIIQGFFRKLDEEDVQIVVERLGKAFTSSELVGIRPS